jgi:hypothetical protein
MFDLGQLGLMPFSARDEASIKEAIAHSDIVINLIGKHFETTHLVPTRRADGKLSRVNFGFDEVHEEIPRRLARLAKEAGVRSFVHMSALSADVESLSKWSRSKARGESAVRGAPPRRRICAARPDARPGETTVSPPATRTIAATMASGAAAFVTVTSSASASCVGSSNGVCSLFCITLNWPSRTNTVAARGRGGRKM